MRAVQRQWVLGCCAVQACAGDDGVAQDTTGVASSSSSAASTSTGDGTIDPTTGSIPDTSSSESTAVATTDVATTDTGDTTGGAAFDCAAAVLCDDFEGVAVDAAPDPSRWTISSPDCSGVGSLAVSDDAGHSGTRSVRG